MSLEEVIQLWREITEKFEHEHPGFRVNFIICTVKTLGKEKIFKDMDIFEKLFNEE